MTTPKPSKLEGEYFAKLEAEKKKKLAEAKALELDQAEKQRLKGLHWMRCPKCGMELHEIVYRGVKLDKCFACAGVFLDDGELERVAGHESGFLKGFLSLFQS